MLLDGRGSSRLSQHGVTAALVALRRGLRRFEPLAVIALDEETKWPAIVAWRGLSQMLYAVAASSQVAEASAFESGPREMEFTMTVCLVGSRRTGWCAIGDSPLYAIKSGLLGVVHNGREHQPEAFANQTHFVSSRARSLDAFSAGLIDSDGIDALLAASDGAASRLEHAAAQVPAEAVRQLTDATASPGIGRPLSRRRLLGVLREKAWERATADDRSVAFLVRRTLSEIGSHTATPVVAL